MSSRHLDSWIVLKIGHDIGMRSLILKGSSDIQHYILSTTDAWTLEAFTLKD